MQVVLTSRAMFATRMRACVMYMHMWVHNKVVQAHHTASGAMMRGGVQGAVTHHVMYCPCAVGSPCAMSLLFVAVSPCESFHIRADIY